MQDDKTRPQDESDWLKVVYEQAWGQYIHEDQIAEQRDTKYLTFLSLFLTAIGVLFTTLVAYLADLDSIFQINKIYGIALLLMIGVLIYLILRFVRIWKSLIDTSERYTEMRLETLRTIEEKMGNIRLAEEKGEIKGLDGFASTRKIIGIIARVSWILLGIVSVCFTAIFFI